MIHWDTLRWKEKDIFDGVDYSWQFDWFTKCLSFNYRSVFSPQATIWKRSWKGWLKSVSFHKHISRSCFDKKIINVIWLTFILTWNWSRRRDWSSIHLIGKHIQVGINSLNFMTVLSLSRLFGLSNTNVRKSSCNLIHYLVRRLI